LALGLGFTLIDNHVEISIQDALGGAFAAAKAKVYESAALHALSEAERTAVQAKLSSLDSLILNLRWPAYTGTNPPAIVRGRQLRALLPSEYRVFVYSVSGAMFNVLEYSASSGVKLDWAFDVIGSGSNRRVFRQFLHPTIPQEWIFILY
jgi:hypothetical protein